MKVVISEIPDEGLDLEGEESLELDVIKLISPVTARLRVEKVGQEVIIRGDLTAHVELQCGRCLKDFRREVLVPVDVVYHPAEELRGEERYELKGEELDMGFYAGDELDIQELMKEQVILNTPMKPLCSEACKGICLRCGTDLNTDSCSCSEKYIDPRLEVLKKLLDK